MAGGTSFHSFFLILFLFCSSTATKYVYKFAKSYTQRFLSYNNFVGNGLKIGFSLVSFNFNLILFYYNYVRCVYIFERLHPAFLIYNAFGGK